MKSSRKIDVSKASLVSLKAELSRKQEEVNKAKVQGTYIHSIPRPKKQTVWSKKNAGVTEREEKDLEQEKEDEDILKKSRAVLEAKSKLYDKLSRQSPADDNQFLVNFQQKVTEEEQQQHTSDECDSSSDPEEQWVDYVDCLGRTRKCLKQDVEFMKEKDCELSKSLGGTEEKLENEAPELVSADMKREMMRQKWEQQEEMLRNKTDVHYQDVLFNEARSHGVGYYSFSQDEAVRKAQQESLSSLRQQTQKVQEATKDARERRRLQMEARLKAARRRKRERMGLPPEEETAAEAKEEQEVKEEPEESNPLEESKPEPKPGPSKPPKVRPWDIGKEGVKEVMSQEEWVNKKRTERPEEFAPPPLYQQEKQKPTLFFSTKQNERPFHKIRRLAASSDFQSSTGTQDTPSGSHMSGEGTEIPPYYMSSTEDTPSVSADMHMRHRATEISPYHMPQPQDEQPSGSVGTRTRGEGIEIPPPPTFDYYGPMSTKMRKSTSKASELENAIDAGLKLLRQQSKEKENTREKGLLGII